MDFYFAIDEKMIETNGMPDRGDGSFSWKLNYNTYMFCTVTSTGGQCWDAIKAYQKEYNSVRPFAICKAKLVNNEDFISVLNCFLTGDSYSSFKVIVSEITWFK